MPSCSLTRPSHIYSAAHRDAVTSISYEDICSVLPTDETLFAVTRQGPSLMPLSQVTFFAKMRRSAIPSAADSDAVAMFEELMERLWR